MSQLGWPAIEGLMMLIISLAGSSSSNGGKTKQRIPSPSPPSPVKALPSLPLTKVLRVSKVVMESHKKGILRRLISAYLTTPPTSSSNSSFTCMPKYSSTNLNFSLGFSPLHSSMPQSLWNSYSGYSNSGTLSQNRHHGGNYMLNTGNQNQPHSLGHLHEPIYMSNNSTISQHSFPNPIVTATEAIITSNPKFQ
ncbi:hypothetical protein JHK82_024432 [Glycine max]|nr:hypothetical protein JHK85_025023 [Glycine max]KAG5133244.1 hypothetical protein JHK82_024432 [Glycine max]